MTNMRVTGGIAVRVCRRIAIKRGSGIFLQEVLVEGERTFLAERDHDDKTCSILTLNVEGTKGSSDKDEHTAYELTVRAWNVLVSIFSGAIEECHFEPSAGMAYLVIRLSLAGTMKFLVEGIPVKDRRYLRHAEAPTTTTA